jgi:hypothetical protein
MATVGDSERAPSSNEDSSAEGWYLDPFGIHERRWISNGNPSNLVRDGNTESTDDPPVRTPSDPFIPVPEDVGLTFGADQLRADDAELELTPDRSAYLQTAIEGSLVNAGNPTFIGPTKTPVGYESPLEREVRHRARRARWKDRWHRWHGGS